MHELVTTLENWTEIFSGWISLPLTFILIGTGLFVTIAIPRIARCDSIVVKPLLNSNFLGCPNMNPLSNTVNEVSTMNPTFEFQTRRLCVSTKQ